MPFNASTREAMLERLIQWGEQQPSVRAMVLTSSMAIPDAPRDRFTDYDVILALTDIQPFHANRDWLEAFGRVLVLYRDPIATYYGYPQSAYVVQFEDGLKIDFTLWPVEVWQAVVADPQLPAEFDAGYQVLLDKDHLTD